jgi:hypothetical protein
MYVYNSYYNGLVLPGLTTAISVGWESSIGIPLFYLLMLITSILAIDSKLYGVSYSEWTA